MKFNPAYRDGSTPVYRLSPFVKLVSYILFLAASLAARGAAGFAVVLAAILAAALTQRLSLRSMGAAVAGMRWFLFFMFVLNAFLSGAGDDPYFRWRFISLSRESIETGLSIVLRVSFAVMITGMYTMCATPLEITRGMRTLFAPLALVRVPVDECAFIISLSLELIPILIGEVNMIVKAQIARGAALDSRRFRDRARDALPLVIPVFTAAFRRADELSEAMEARGYTGAPRRAGLRGGVRNGGRRRSRGAIMRDLASVILCAALLALSIYLRRFVI